MLACSYASDVLWILWACVALVRGHEASLGLLTTYGVCFMINWYSLRTYDRYAFTALLHFEWGVWSASSVLGILTRIFDAILHVIVPVLMLIWYGKYVQLWMSVTGMMSVVAMYRLRESTRIPFRRYIFYQFAPSRSRHFWDAAFRVELFLHGSIPLFCWVAQEHSFVLYSCTIVIGGFAISVQLTRLMLLPKIRLAAANIMSRLLAQGNIQAALASQTQEAGAQTDILVHDSNFWLDWMSDGLVAIGESYVSGQWSVNPHSQLSLDVVLFRLLTLPVEARREMYQSWSARFVSLSTRLFYFPSSAASHIVGSVSDQFDLTIAFRRSYLGENVLQTFGIWQDPTDTLEIAQERTLRMLAQKLLLTQGNIVLDLYGNSSGAVACYFASNYRVQVISIVNSNVEKTVAETMAQNQNVHSHVHFISLNGRSLIDVLRSLPSSFDAIVASNLLEKCSDMPSILTILKAKARGRMVLDFVATPTRANTHAWSNKYICPHHPTMALSYATVRGCMNDIGWIVVEAQNYCEHYDRTCVAWHDAFQENATALPASFRRTWEFYLLHTAACYRARNLQIYQVTLQL